MRRAKRSLQLLLAVIVLLALLLTPSVSASAASDYDDVFGVTTRARVSDTYDNHTCTARDIATLWDDYLFDNSSWSHAVYGAGTDRETVQSALSVVMENKSGVVVTERMFRVAAGVGNYVFGEGDTGVQVVFTPDASNETTFFTHGGLNYAALKGSGVFPIYVVILGQYWNSTLSSCSIGVAVSRVVASNASNSALLSSEAYVGREDFESANSTWQQVFVDSPIIYPTGYAGATVPAAPPAAKFIAMGDSFSSGEGNEPFEPGTDTGSNTCHRSTNAWPRMLQNDLNLGSMALVACSGAVSDYIINEYNQENVELPQAAYVSSETQLITISIGGNDVGFGGVLTTCTLATNEGATAEEKHLIEHNACIAAIDDAREIAGSAAFRNKLSTVFSGLRSLGGQNLQIVVVGYPNLFPAYADIVGSCVWGNGQPSTSGRDLASDEAGKSRLLQSELNAAIVNAVGMTNDSNIHFVDPTNAFVGHELCRPSPWFNNVVPSVDPVLRRGSYHPDSNGQVAYADAVGAVINNL